MLAPPELQKIHPLGKSPLLTIENDGMSEPLVLAESGFMTEYIIDHFATHLAPKRWKDGQEGQAGGETEAWLRYRHLMHFSEGSMMPNLLMLLVASSKYLLGAIQIPTDRKQAIENARVPFFLKPIVRGVTGKLRSAFLPQIKQQLDFLESQLASAPDGGEFLCGKELTGADIMMSFPLQAGGSRAGLTKESHPKLAAYVSRLESMNTFKKSIEKIVEVDGEYEGLTL